MEDMKQIAEKEISSLDVVQLESSDDDIPFDDLATDNFMDDADKLALIGRKPLDGDQVAASRHSLRRGLDEDEDDIDSEEEKDILKGIKDEIESKVREEMKDELEVYKAKLLAIESGNLPEDMRNDNKPELTDAEREEMDPKLKEAIVKMQKLDRILRKKVKREREVKRERLILEKRLKDEIADMQHGASNYKEIKTNTEKFLALAPPPSHNEGVTLDYEEEEDIPPLFQTQIDDCEIKKSSRRKNSVKDESDRDSRAGSDRKTPAGDGIGSRADSTTSRGEGGKQRGKQKNFIKRNKELAAAANEVIAMTDDEKERLQTLLGDIDDLDEECEEVTGSSIFQLALNPGDGFVPDNVELKSLTNIDERLKYLMPEDDFLSISGPGNSQFSTPRPALFTRVGVKSNLLDGFGEQVLYQTKEERDLKARLDSIEKKLEMFNAPNDTETGRSDCHLSDEQLDDLLNQCARSMSRTSVMDTPDSTARSESSSRLALMVNPPKLSNEQLQQLLSEAYFPMSSQLAALKEEGGDDEDEISAEAWKAIVEQPLDGEEIGDYVDDDEDIDDDDDDDGIDKRTKSCNVDSKNISRNALFDDNEELDKSYKYDNLLAGKDEVSDSVNEFHQDDNLLSSQRSSGKKSLSKNFKGFPKISSSSNLSMTGSTTSISDNFIQKKEETPQSSSDNIRLPSISSNSFLVQSSQGLNNNKSSPSRAIPSSAAKEPIPMVRNNLSDMSLTSFSEETWNSPQQHPEQGNSHRTAPRPPPY